MRIIAGTAKGRKLLGDPGPGVRPLMDRIKESIFGLLGPALTGQNVLDLFAGSGAFGLEAVSRGAGTAWFVDSSREAIRVLEENIQRLQFAGQARTVCGPAEDFVRTTDQMFDVIFIDPPFADFRTVVHPVVNAIVERKLLQPHGVLLMRFFHKDTYETARLRLSREKKYGENKVVFYEWPQTGKEAA